MNVNMLNHDEIPDLRGLKIPNDVFEIEESISDHEHLNNLLMNPDFLCWSWKKTKKFSAD